LDTLDFSQPGVLTATDPRIAVDDNYVYYRLKTRPLQRLPFGADPLSRDLAANPYVEITQGIQSFDDDVPLVADKAVWVRAWGRTAAGPSTGGVEAELHLVRGGVTVTEGHPFTPINGTKYMWPVAEDVPDRTTTDSGWLFHVPASWTSAGDVTFRILVDPRNAVNDDDLVNNGVKKVVHFVDRPPSCIVFIPVRTHAPIPSYHDPNTAAMWERYTALWPTRELKRYQQSEPVEELQVCWWGIIPYPCFGPYELPDDSSWVLASLVTRDTFTDDPDACDDAGARTHYVGMVHPATETGSGGGTVRGTGNLCLAASWVKFADHDPPTPEEQKDSMWPTAGFTLAHESAHNYHRQHVDCGNPDNPDPTYPYSPRKLSFDDPNATSTHFGFDGRSVEPISNLEAADLMSYAEHRWTSDWTYKHLFASVEDFSVFDCVWDEICGPHDGYSIDFPWDDRVADLSGASREGESPWAYEIASTTDVVLVNGIIGPTTRSGHLNRAWVYPAADASAGLLEKWGRRAAPSTTDFSQRRPIEYTVRMLDGIGVVLDERVVIPRETPQPESADYAAIFDISFPKPAGRIATIQLLADGLVLDSHSPGLSDPVVSISSPAGGETFTHQMTVTWSATDANHDDTLLSTVQYSPNAGASWTVVADSAPVHPATGETTLNLDLAHGIAGSSPSSLLRVVVSDGFNTGVATSLPFQVSNRTPQPMIVSPAEAQSFRVGEPVIIRGEVDDKEDGGLGGSSLRWSINRVQAGTGHEMVAEGLQPGIYSLDPRG
jgi:hypothetical protein